MEAALLVERDRPAHGAGGYSPFVSECLTSGAAAARVNTIVTRVPCPGDDSNLRAALAFSRKDWTISALN
jgi:hypothetical protein